MAFCVRETGKESVMQVQPYPVPSLRTDTNNPNHHLWLNNGTFYIAYTALTSPVTAERIRRSLKTRDLAIACARRDRLLEKTGVTA
jgi:hypothetical protein